MTRRLRVTVTAARDIAEVLAASEETFGTAARDRYARLIADSLDQLREGDPPASLARPELGEGVRTIHLRLCRSGSFAPDRVRRPRHLIAYRTEATFVEVLRLLHERMDLPRHLPPGEGG